LFEAAFLTPICYGYELMRLLFGKMCDRQLGWLLLISILMARVRSFAVAQDDIVGMARVRSFAVAQDDIVRMARVRSFAVAQDDIVGVARVRSFAVAQDDIVRMASTY